MSQFAKYHALGNDYLVLERGAWVGAEAGAPPPVALLRAVCDRHHGLGADGVLFEGSAGEGRLALRVFNPDGSEAETSGNGLRIFARYLWDRRRVSGDAFEVATRGGGARCRVSDDGATVSVEMGQARFDSAAIPVSGPRREVVGETLEVLGEPLRFTAVTVGNPHCVVHGVEVSPATTLRLGPALETHPAFPARTNVQFVRVIDRGRIEAEVWERGAGRTLASGSSACAAAAASVRLGLCDRDVTVAMPGGELAVQVSSTFDVTVSGPVRKVAEGRLADDLLRGVRVDAAGAQAAGTIAYHVNAPLDVERFVDLLRRSTLAERRPVDDLACMAGMLAHADLTLTAWDGDRLVGVARSVTDFHYACYLSDLAVDSAYQGTGIGRELVRRSVAALGPRCTLRLISAPAAMDYYPRIGFVRNERCWEVPAGSPSPVNARSAGDAHA